MVSALVILMGIISANSGTLNSCDFGAPNPDAPAEIEQFAFMVGNHRVEAHVWTEDGWSEEYFEAEWHGRWGLDGMAIVDEWHGVVFSPDIPQNLGVNVRVYDEETGRWNMVWQQTQNSESQVLQAEMRDDGYLHMWRVYPDGPEPKSLFFEVIDDGHWVRFDHTILEDGTTVPRLRIDAYEIPCED